MAGRTNKLTGTIIHLEIFHAEPALLRFVSFLAPVYRTQVSSGICKTDIPLSKLRVRHKGINS